MRVRRVVLAVMLSSSAIMLMGCDPVQHAWIDNESDVDVVVTVDGDEAVLVHAGASGFAYSRLGSTPDARQVAVLTPECGLLAQTNTTANGAWVLRIRVQPGGGVTFEHAPNLGALQTKGTLTTTDKCEGSTAPER